MGETLLKFKPEPAFPLASINPEDDQVGMSLRDYFAAKAMQAMVQAEYGHRVSNGAWAKDAYEMADAMMKARKDKTNTVKEVDLYINVDAGVVDTVYGDAIPDNIKINFHVRDRVDIKAGDQIDPLPFDYQPSKVYYG